MDKILATALFLCLAFTSVKAQDTTLTGNYYGKNLYITNPYDENNNTFCISKVILNDTALGQEVASSSFEIDFTVYGVLINAPVKIIISYSSGCKFKILNPEVLKLKSLFSFTTIKIDKNGKIIWTTKGEIDNSLVVEQYRWKKWVTVGEIEVNDTVKKTTFSFESKPHFGPNQFRISHTDSQGNTVTSKPIKYRSLTIKELFLVTQKVTTQLDFTGETMYEIFDEKGNFLSDGYSKSVDISELPKGKYWINYDNKTEMFTKK